MQYRLCSAHALHAQCEHRLKTIHPYRRNHIHALAMGLEISSKPLPYLLDQLLIIQQEVSASVSAPPWVLILDGSRNSQGLLVS